MDSDLVMNGRHVMKRLLACCAVLLLVAGCGLVRDGVDGIHEMDATTHAVGSPMSTTQTFWVLDGVSVINTQKTIDDHLVSWISGRDCSTVRASKGDHYCIDKPEPQPSLTQVSYCYKTLAAIDCYDQPVAADSARFVGTHTTNVPVGK